MATASNPGGVERYRLRPATAADARCLADLATQLGYPASAAEVEQRLKRIGDSQDHFVCVAELDEGRSVDRTGAVVGWIHAFVSQLVESDLHVEIGGLVVDRNQRGLGVGKALLERAEAWALSKGIREVSLRSNVIRKDAHRFYERLGYGIVKTQYAFSKKL